MESHYHMFMNACWSDAAVGGTVLALALFMMFISERVFNSYIMSDSARTLKCLAFLGPIAIAIVDEPFFIKIKNIFHKFWWNHLAKSFGLSRMGPSTVGL